MQLREVSYNDACNDLASICEPAAFAAKFGAPLSDLPLLIEQKVDQPIVLSSLYVLHLYVLHLLATRVCLYTLIMLHAHLLSLCVDMDQFPLLVSSDHLSVRPSQSRH